MRLNEYHCHNTVNHITLTLELVLDYRKGLLCSIEYIYLFYTVWIIRTQYKTNFTR